MKTCTRWIAAACLGTWLSANAQTSPAGLWKSMDDQTGKPKSLIRISEHHGEYHGRIEKLFRAPQEDPSPKCTKCDGIHKDQPIIGMTIITGMRQDGSDYSGGEILDPASGKRYKSRMTLSGDGMQLGVRGYVGMPLFGRTQTWIRQD